MTNGMGTPWVRPTRLRALARDALVASFAVPALPLILAAKLGGFAGAAEVASLVPGRVGLWLRRSFYAFALADCARDVSVGFLTTFAHRDAVVGPGVWVGSRCTLGRVVLEAGATLGSNVDVLSGRRQHGTGAVGVSVREQAGEYRRVTVGARAWLGNGCTVMADVGADAVVGAGSVVVKPIGAATVAAGNPARAIRERGGRPCS